MRLEGERVGGRGSPARSGGSRSPTTACRAIALHWQGRRVTTTLAPERRGLTVRRPTRATCIANSDDLSCAENYETTSGYSETRWHPGHGCARQRLDDGGAGARV